MTSESYRATVSRRIKLDDGGWLEKGTVVLVRPHIGFYKDEWVMNDAVHGLAVIKGSHLIFKGNSADTAMSPRMNMKLPKGWKLPPAQFSNAVIDVYGVNGFDFIKWEDSKEWRLFNAGKAAAFSDMAAEAAGQFKEAKEKSR